MKSLDAKIDQDCFKESIRHIYLGSRLFTCSAHIEDIKGCSLRDDFVIQIADGKHHQPLQKTVTYLSSGNAHLFCMQPGALTGAFSSNTRIQTRGSSLGQAPLFPY